MKLPIFGRCNLCGWPVLRLNRGLFGTRCLRCFSTQIHRAVGTVIESFAFSPEGAVYELSSKGALFLFLKKRFTTFYYSEFFDGIPGGETKGGVPCQDVQDLKLPDGSFDLVTSTEVFEHVPDDRKGFSEVHRVLKPGGRFIFTVPLLASEETIVRAVLRPDRTIEHRMAPEYHSDRLRGKGKVLAYRTYGRDILHTLESAGFAPEVRTIDSERHMIEEQPVLVCRKESTRP